MARSHPVFDWSSVPFWAFLALLVWIPVPLGSNRAWAWTALEAWIFILIAACLVLWAARMLAVSDALRASWPALVVLSFWLAEQTLHVLSLPPSWVEALSPEAFRMHSLTQVLGMKPEAMTLSVDPHAARVSLMKSFAYSGAFFLALALFNRRSRVLMACRVLVYSAVVYSVYAVLLHLASVTKVWFGALIAYETWPTGTYANRNHFAGYLEMMLAIGIGLLISSLSERRIDSWKKLARVTIEWILSPKMLLRLGLCVLVIALTTTHSRMGNTGFFVSLLIAGTIGITLSKHATRNTVLLLVSLIVIDLIIVGSWFGVEKLTERLQETTIDDVREREAPAAYTIPLVKDYLVFGAGPGSFYTVFPKYRPESITLYYNLAHNDYAQFAAESGLLGIGLVGLFVTMGLVCAFIAQYRRRDPLMRGMSFACMMGVTAILIHSWTDFNLQIPANATFFMVLLALGWISLFHDRRGAHEI